MFHIRGDFEAAVVLFRRLIAVHPTAEGHTFLRWSLSKLGKIQEALSECKKAIAIDPEFGNPYNEIGVYLIDLGRPDEAVPWLEKATKAKRYCFYQFAHFNLGRVLLDARQAGSCTHRISEDSAARPRLCARQDGY
ncbi:MAG: hypothetical protein CL569_01605 [Alphaproteobacteria bacterium]|nr:hypothetical protein [Alphaproteobacteria bacterium]